MGIECSLQNPAFPQVPCHSSHTGLPKWRSHLARRSRAANLLSPRRRWQRFPSRIFIKWHLIFLLGPRKNWSIDPGNVVLSIVWGNFNCVTCHHSSRLLCFDPRIKLSINNSCELIVGGENGDAMYMLSRSKNQFFQYREMFLDCLQRDEPWKSFMQCGHNISL
jgi:hypothetical protein